MKTLTEQINESFIVNEGSFSTKIKDLLAADKFRAEISKNFDKSLSMDLSTLKKFGAESDDYAAVEKILKSNNIEYDLKDDWIKFKKKDL